MSGPERTCVGCRCKAESLGLIRWVAMPQEQAGEPLTVAHDLYGKAPGRGVWLCPKMDCLTQAVRKRAFSRGLQVPELHVPEVGLLADRLHKGLRTRFRQRLALARRAGTVSAGENRVARAFKDGRSGVLILASDLSVSSRKKQVSNAVRKGVHVVEPGMVGEELGQCLGREFAGIILVEGQPFAGELECLARQWNGLVQEDRPQESAH